jgi:flagellar basal body-associated protein FliL
VRKKLIIALVVVLAGAGGAYKFVFSAKGSSTKEKIAGALVALPQEFVVNLEGDHYGKVSVALLLASAPPASADGSAPVPVENAAVRAVITDELTGLQPKQLTDRRLRHQLVMRLLKALRTRTDEQVKQVMLTDIAVQ